jgi:prophage regulatory protein
MANQHCVILRRNDVEKRVGLKRSSIYALIAKDAFPKPIELSQRSRGWIEAEIDDWIESRVANRDTSMEVNHG